MIFYGKEESQGWYVSTPNTIASICFDHEDSEEDFKLWNKCSDGYWNGGLVMIEGYYYRIEKISISSIFSSTLYTLKKP